MSTEWNYSKLASSYDKRADYSGEAIDKLLSQISTVPWKPVADIGAGTGKLTKELLKRGLTVKAIEPNEEMRKYGVINTQGKSVEYIDGTGENTTLPDSSVYAAFFGSSFNVLDRKKALTEVARILVPNGWFSCMWNHRDLDDELQSSIEDIVRKCIPEYNYGTRREDQSSIIEDSDLFRNVQRIEVKFTQIVKVTDYITAWKSHATLERQAGDKFQKIIDSIQSELCEIEEISVPYTTKIWFAQLKIPKNDWSAEAYSWSERIV